MNINSNLTISEISKVLKQYSFYNGKTFRIIPIKKSPYGTIVRIKSSGFDLLIKKYKSSVPTKKFLLPHKIQLKLNQNNFPCPILEKNIDGNTLTKSGNFYYVVQSWLKGKIINPEKIPKSEAINIIAQIGMMFGLFHKIMTKINITDINKYHNNTTKSLFRSSNIKSRKIFKWEIFKPLLHTRIQIRFRKSDFDRWILSYLPKIKEYSRELYNFPFSNYPSLKKYIPAHADIHWENLLFENNKLVGLFDFDNANICPREWDIGQTIAQICYCNIKHIQIFLQEYYSISGYKPDLTILPTIMRFKYIRLLLWKINQHYNHNEVSFENFGDFYHIADCINWLDNNEKVLFNIKIRD